MLSRVRAALIKHLTPVSSRSEEEMPQISNSSLGQEADSNKKNQQFQRFTPKTPELPVPASNPAQKQTSSPPKLVLIQNPKTNDKPTGEPPHSQSWLELFALFKGERTTLLNWFGKKLYQSSLKRQKELGKSKQGLMLDHKAE